LNDLWYFNTSSLEWRWVSGSEMPNQIGVYCPDNYIIDPVTNEGCTPRKSSLPYFNNPY